MGLFLSNVVVSQIVDRKCVEAVNFPRVFCQKVLASSFLSHKTQI